jgi:O-antigen/teichoic acid export membrane protein
VVARLITYLLTPFLTRVLTGARGALEYGTYTTIYSWLPLLNVLFTYGMETAFFRFSSSENKSSLYRTQTSALLLTTLLLCALMIVFATPIADFAEVPGRADYVWICAAIVGMDTMAALPYARLRGENKPRKYAAIKVVGILVFVGTVVALFSMRGWVESNPGGAFSAWWSQYWGLGFVLVANAVQSALTLVMLSKELADFRLQIDRTVLNKVLRYGWPILLTGFAGLFNDSLNRVMFVKLHDGSREENLKLIGQFGAATRLAVMINLAIQAFRMAAEPFFFSLAGKEDAPRTYARVMKWFVILLAGMFLSVALFLDVWRHFLGRGFRGDINLVPVLLMSYVLLGIYYNLTVWYKNTDRTIYGTYTVCIGAAVAILINVLFIPRIGTAACAWSMLASAVVMVAVSYAWGQKFYPVPYGVGRLVGYLVFAVMLWGVQYWVMAFTDIAWLQVASGLVLMVVFGAAVWRTESVEIRSMLNNSQRIP